jgi:hypothetical protein
MKCQLHSIADNVRSCHQLTRINIIMRLSEYADQDPFWARFVEVPSGCWEWQGSRNQLGYGRSGKTYSHRVAYEKAVGLIPEGLDLDHLCRNRGCGNPSHLEPVTHYENCRRGSQANQTHCVNGHAFDGDNLIWRFRRTGAPYRQCRQCTYDRARVQVRRKKGGVNQAERS